MANKKNEWTYADLVAQYNAYADNNKPAEYSSENTALMKAAQDAYLNREKFSYDPNADAIYQNYKNSAISNSRLAAENARGQAAAMTGGYSNSYAEAVANQASQAQMAQLNDKMLDLYQLAANRYDAEGNELLNKYNMYANAEANDYSRYLNNINAYNTELNRLGTLAQNARDAEFAQQKFDYQKQQDANDLAYKYYAAAQSSNEAALKQQLADAQALLDEYNQKATSIPLNKSVESKIEKEVYKEGYATVEEAVKFIGSKYGEKGYNEEQIMDFIEQLYLTMPGHKTAGAYLKPGAYIKK